MGAFHFHLSSDRMANNEDNSRPRGRPTTNEQEMRTKAQVIKDALKVKLGVNGLSRPMRHGMHYNLYSHVYTTLPKNQK
eukprot:scaffold15403_cov73-Cylindrotheca_fusiformis.AAC.1